MLDKIQVFELCTTQTVDFFPQIHFSVFRPLRTRIRLCTTLVLAPLYTIYS